MQPYQLSDGITQSMLQSFAACRRRSQLSLEGWEPITGGSSRSTYFGSVFHNALDLAYKNMDSDPIKVFRDWRNKHEVEIAANEFSQERIDDMCFLLDKVDVLFRHYVAHYVMDFDPAQHIDSEIVFDVEWSGFRLRGKIDRLFRVHDREWLEETKTRSRVDDLAIEGQLAFDFQTQFYALCMYLLRGVQVEGVRYNVIRNPSLKLGKKETVSAFLQRLDKDVSARQEHYFKRFPYAFSFPGRQRFMDDLIRKLRDFSTWHRTLGGTYDSTYKNESACLYPFKCQFFDACSSGDLVNYAQTKVLFEELIDGETVK